MRRTAIAVAVALAATLTAAIAFLLAPHPAVAGGGSVPCEDGLAGVYPCRNINLYSHLALDQLGSESGVEAANLWGWADPETGTPYVLLGLLDTLAMLDVSDPAHPIQVGLLPNQTVTNPQKYRDVKVFADHAFVIADQFSDHGLQVFDLNRLRTVVAGTTTFSPTAIYTGFGDAHNLFINADSAFAYIVRTTDPAGPDPCNAAVLMLDVQDPLNPAFAGCLAEAHGPASDAMCAVYHGPDAAFQGRELCVVASDDNIVVGDVTDKGAPLILADLTYPDVHRAHLAWLTDDHRFFVSADMNDEMMTGFNTRIYIWDFTQVMSPTLAAVYEGPTPASDHNVWVDGHYAYIGNFRAGVRVLNLRNIAGATFSDTMVTEAAFVDLYPADDNAGHVGGAWAVYPYFDDDLIAVSDKTNGLFLLELDLVERYLPVFWRAP